MTPEQEKEFDELVQKTMLFKLENFATKNEDDIKDFISSLLKEERARIEHRIRLTEEALLKAKGEPITEQMLEFAIQQLRALTPDTNQTDLQE